MTCSPEGPLNKASTVSRKENLLRALVAAFSVGRDTDRLCCQAKTFPWQGKKRKVNSGPGGSSGVGKHENKEGLAGRAPTVSQVLFCAPSLNYSTQSVLEVLQDG